MRIRGPAATAGVLTRQREHLRATVATALDCSAGSGGLGVRYDERHWFCLTAERTGDTTTVTARAEVCTSFTCRVMGLFATNGEPAFRAWHYRGCDEQHTGPGCAFHARG